MAEARVPDYQRAERLDEALSRLAEGRFAVLAGGTDLFPAYADRAIDTAVLDISGIASLRGIGAIADGWRIGALTTWTEVQSSSLPLWARALREAAREVGGVQVQNMATVAGNICNASPAADGIVPLLALDARVVLESCSGRREMSLAEFLVGSRQTRRRADELVTALDIPARSPRARSRFRKLGHRRYLVISVAMVAVVLDFDDSECIDYAGIAVGACSASARRLPDLEKRLIGRRARDDRAAMVLDEDLRELTPIDDIRGTRRYRLDAVGTLLRRSLREALL
jgi:CO/xanthine dehydrogenase FAD-binding subunit